HEVAPEERPGRGDAAQLFQHQRELEDAEPETALGLGDDEAHPAERGHLRVERGRDPVGRRRGLAHECGRTLAREEVARHAPERARRPPRPWVPARRRRLWKVCCVRVVAPSMFRSWAGVALATCQPLLRPPTRFACGTRTSSKKTSLKPASPVIWTSGRTVMPGDFMSIRR